MCMAKFILLRNMLGTREQGWTLWNGKEVVEMTAKEIKDALAKGEAVYGLEVGEDGELALGRNFFTRNIMEHRQVNNYKPMLEEENCLANVFYIVTGRADNGEYEVISTKFERTTFSEEKTKIMLSMGIISAGAKLEGDKVVLPDLKKEVKESRKPVEPKSEKSEEKAEPKVEKQGQGQP